MTVKQISQHIKKARKDKKMTQEQLAQVCGVGRRFISELESGKKQRYDLVLTLRVLQRLGLRLQLSSEQ